MSWLERIQKDISITTGDGKVYQPLYTNANKVREYNVSEFTFNNVSGSFVDRKLPKGYKYELELHFQGSDYVEQTEAFLNSADNPNAWVIQHPLYDQLRVQPSSCVVDDTVINISTIRATVISTIELDEVTKVSMSTTDEVKAMVEAQMVELNNAFVSREPIIDASLKNKLNKSAMERMKTLSKQITNSLDANKYINVYNELSNNLIQPGASVLSIVDAMQRFSALPYQFIDTTFNKIKMLGSQYEMLKKGISNIGKRTSKRTFEADGLNTIFSMAIAGIEYVSSSLDNMNMIIELIDTIHGYYEDFIDTLDAMVSDNISTLDGYVPDYESIRVLSVVIDKTLVYLLTIAKDGKVERSLMLTEDTTIYELTNKLYGYDDNDENLRKLIRTNNIGINEYLMLSKGRNIKYFK